MAFRWANDKDGMLIPREIGAAPIMPTLYKVFGWDKSDKYLIQGAVIEKKNAKLLVFYLE